jgi:iron-sulfur cluster insertion protein
MISLTEVAKEKMIRIALEEGNVPLVRAKIAGGGCAGFSYDLFYEDEDKVTETDEVFDHDGIKIVVDVMSYQYLEGSTIDYVDSMMGGGFKFENPKSTGSCGCGNSVSF